MKGRRNHTEMAPGIPCRNAVGTTSGHRSVRDARIGLHAPFKTLPFGPFFSSWIAIESFRHPIKTLSGNASRKQFGNPFRNGSIRGNLLSPIPSSLMSSFLTVKEAARLTGKSPSSIRRIIYPIIHDDSHADRAQIQPSVEEAMQLRVKGENFAWRLSEELLRRELPADESSSSDRILSPSKSSNQAEGELLAMLRGELEIKNHQIAQQSELISKQMELINGLSERLREGNVLLGTLQQRIALPEARPANPTVPAKPNRATSAKPEKGSTIPPKNLKPKKSWLSGLFG